MLETYATGAILSNTIREIIIYGKTRVKGSPLDQEITTAYHRALRSWTRHHGTSSERHSIYHNLGKLLEQFALVRSGVSDNEVSKLLELFKRELDSSSLATAWLNSMKLEMTAKVIYYLAKPEELVALGDVLIKLHSKFPNLDDLQNENYFTDLRIFDKINMLLDVEHICLLSAGPGSGKSVLSKAIGFTFEKSDSANRVYFLDLRVNNDINVKAILKEVDRLKNSLIILDNCHLNSDLISNLVSRWKPEQCKLLLVSRPLSSVSGSDNYQDLLFEKTVGIDVDELLIKGIIRTRVSSAQFDKLEIGNIESLIRKTKGDFHLLNFYLDAWEGNQGLTLSSIDKVEIYDSIYKRYIVPFDSTVLSLLVTFGAFEIKIQESFVINSPKALSKLVNLGFVEKEIVATENTLMGTRERLASRVYVQYFHSSPARYIADTLRHFGTQVSLLANFVGYLESLPVNFCELFYQFNQNPELLKPSFLCELITEIKNRQLFERWIKKHIDIVLKNETMLIYSFYFHKSVSICDSQYSEICLELLAEEFLGTSYKETYLKRFKPFYQLLFVLRLSAPCAKKLLGEPLDFKRLGEQAEQELVGVAAIQRAIFFLRKNGVSPESIKIFCGAIRYDRLGRQAEANQVGISVISNLISQFSQNGVPRSSI